LASVQKGSQETPDFGDSLLLAEIRREVFKRAYSYTTMGLRIEYSPIVDNVGVIGAVHFVRDWVFTVDGVNISEVQK
jgi:hypothetical protein